MESDKTEEQEIQSEMKPIKPKRTRVMTEHMLEQLKKAREKAKETHALQSSLTNKKKTLTKLERMSEIVEVDKKLIDASKPLIDSVAIRMKSEEDEKKMKKKTESDRTDKEPEKKVENKNEVKPTETLLDKSVEKPTETLLDKSVEKPIKEEVKVIYKRKPKKRIVYVSESSDESESEEEMIREKIVKKPSRKSQLRELEIEARRMQLEAEKRASHYEESRQKHILNLVSRLGLR